MQPHTNQIKSNQTNPNRIPQPTTFNMTSAVISQLVDHLSTCEGKIGDLPEGLEQSELLETLRKIQKPTKKKTKKVKDPLKPKRGQTAYFIWLGENRSRIKSELGDDTKVGPIAKEAGRQWKELSDEEKEPFQEKSKEDRARYQKEMESYEPSEPRETYDAEDYPEAPSSWSGPFEMKYLWKNAKGVDGKAKSFKSFEEAVEAANQMSGDECCGITKTARGYSLRLGPDLLSTPTGKEKSGLASWIKGTPSEIVQMESSKPMKVSEIVVPEESKKTEKKEKKKPVMNVKKVEPEPEPEVEDEEDEDLDVEEIEIDGVTYYKTEDGKLFDPETSDCVGKYVDGKIVEE